MNTFILNLQSSIQFEQLNNVVSFVGEDSSGSFGILAGHSRMMTCLKFGLSWFRSETNEIEYLALPGAMLYFVDNQLFINTRHYLRSKNYQTMVAALEHELFEEEKDIQSIKESLRRLDEEILKRLWELKRRHSYEIE